MISRHRYESVKKSTQAWKRSHPVHTRRIQYKTCTKHYIMHANQKRLHKAQHWLILGRDYLNHKKTATK